MNELLGFANFTVFTWHMTGFAISLGLVIFVFYVGIQRERALKLRENHPHCKFYPAEATDLHNFHKQNWQASEYYRIHKTYKPLIGDAVHLIDTEIENPNGEVFAVGRCADRQGAVAFFRGKYRVIKTLRTPD